MCEDTNIMIQILETDNKKEAPMIAVIIPSLIHVLYADVMVVDAVALGRRMGRQCTVLVLDAGAGEVHSIMFPGVSVTSSSHHYK